MAQKPLNLGEVLFEFRRVGNVLRIAAIDPASGIEVVTVGNPGYSRELLKRAAARKLAYVLSKKQRDDN